MQSSQLLPPQTAAPAEVAATLPAGREAAPETGDGSFGAVLESRMNAAASPDASPPGNDAAAAAEAVSTAQAPGDAVLASLIAGLAAGAVPQAPVGVQPVVAPQADDGSAVVRAPADEFAPARTLPAGMALRPERASDGAAAVPGAAASTEADPGAFARLLPVASGISPPATIAIATSPEAAVRAQVSDSGGAALRIMPEATPRADALPATAGASGEAPAEAAPPPRVSVRASFGSEGWSSALADRVTWIAQARQPSAELTLNPPQLGPVEVRVSVSADQQATLSFHSPHAAVREAIQGSLPRLQEAFAAGGLQLGDVFVGSGPAGFGQDQRPARDGGGESGRRGSGPEAVSAMPAPAAVTWLRSGSPGQVDLFA
jgi:flagellar hook-length control protein FliK